MNKWILRIVPIVVAVTIIFGINYATHSYAILNATVIGTRLDLPGDGFLGMKGRYLSMINLTDSYPHKIPIDSTRSDCPLASGQIIIVRVLLQEGFILYHGNLPVTANDTLYRADGNSFVSWNGCAA